MKVFIIPTLCAIFFIVLSNFIGPILSTACLIGALSGIYLITNPKKLVSVYALTALYATPLFAYFPLANIVGTLILLFVGFSLILLLAMKSVKFGFEIKYLALIFFVGLLGAFNGDFILVNFFQMLLAYLGGIVFFYLVTQLLNGKFPDKIKLHLTIFFFVQLLMNVAYFLKINPIYHRLIYSQFDFAVGTIGFCNLVAYAMLVYIYWIIVSIKETRSVSIKNLIIGILAFFQLYLTHTAHAWGLLFLGISALIITFVHKRLRILLIALALFLGSIGLKIYLSNPNTYFRFDREVLNGPRVQLFEKLLDRDYMSLFIGEGPGAVISGVALSSVTPLAMNYVGDIYLTASGQESLYGASIMQQPVNDVSVIFAELGLVGTLLYFGFIISVALRVWLRYIRNEYESLDQRIMAGTFMPLVITYLSVSLLIQNLNLDSVNVILWGWAALVWNPVKLKKVIK